jgi:uncharacterized protein
MEQRLSLVTLGVRDLAASRAFYHRLGWKVSPPSNESVTFFQCGGMVFALWGRDDLAKDAGVSASGNGFANISLALNVRRKDEVDAMMQEAKKAGATILKPRRRDTLGRLHRLLRGPRRVRLGDRLEPRFRDSAGWRDQAAGLNSTSRTAQQRRDFK